jgi:hypothetical protein
MALSIEFLRKDKPSGSLAYSLTAVNVMLALTHYYGLILILFENLAFIFSAKNTGQNKKISLWWTGQGVLLLLFSFWLTGFSYHALHLEQGHVSGHIDFPALLYFLTPNTGAYLVPVAAAMKLKPNTLTVNVLPYVFLGVFGLYLARIFFIKSLKSRSAGFKELTAIMKDRKGLLIKLSVLFLCSLLMLIFSREFYAGPNLPSDFDMSVNFREALVFLFLGFLCILLGVFLGSIRIKRSSEDSGDYSYLFIGFFPLFTVALIEITGILFRPTFQIKNLIIILPCLITGVSVTLACLKRDLLMVAIITLLTAGFIFQTEELLRFIQKFDYKRVAVEIVSESVALEKDISIAVLSKETRVSMRHYLDKAEIIDCRVDCGKKLTGKDFVFWVWHMSGHIKEKRYIPLLKDNFQRGTVLDIIESGKVRGVLVKY